MVNGLGYKRRTRFGWKYLLVVILLAAVIMAGLESTGKTHFLHKDNPKPTNQKATETTGNKTKEGEVTPNKGLPKDSSSTTTEQVPTNPSLSVTIASASQSNGLVQAVAKTSSDGTCVFLYSPADGGKPVTREVEVNSGTCSVDISQNEFSYLGQWNLTVTYYNNGAKAEDTKDVAIH